MAASQLSWCSGGARMKLSKRRAARYNVEALLASAVASQIVLKIARYPRRTGLGTDFGRMRYPSARSVAGSWGRRPPKRRAASTIAEVAVTGTSKRSSVALVPSCKLQ